MKERQFKNVIQIAVLLLALLCLFLTTLRDSKGQRAYESSNSPDVVEDAQKIDRRIDEDGNQDTDGIFDINDSSAGENELGGFDNEKSEYQENVISDSENTVSLGKYCYAGYYTDNPEELGLALEADKVGAVKADMGFCKEYYVSHICDNSGEGEETITLEDGSIVNAQIEDGFQFSINYEKRGANFSAESKEYDIMLLCDDELRCRVHSLDGGVAGIGNFNRIKITRCECD